MTSHAPGTLPAVIHDLSSSISSLPAQLSTVNTTLLSALLSTLSDELRPVAPSLSVGLQQKLLSDSDFVKSHISELGGLVARIPDKTLEKSSTVDVASLIRLFNDRYTIWTVYSPDLWAILLLFSIAVAVKLATNVALDKGSIARAQRVFAEQNKGVVVKEEIARGILRRPVISAIGRGLNLVASLIALGLQLSAWHIFVISSTSEPVRFDEVARLYLALKILLVSYGADLLVGDYPYGSYLHHIFTFVLMGVGQITVVETSNPHFYRLAQWLVLQGTALPTTFLSLFFYHTRAYFAAQGLGYRPQLQRNLLKGAYHTLRVTKYLCYAQKFIPALFSIYWLGQMWDDMKTNPYGQAWLFLCTVTLSALLVLQMTVFNDAIFPLCNHMRYQLYGGERPSRHGPIAQLVRTLFFSHKPAGRPQDYARIDVKESTPARSEEKERPDAVSWPSNESTPSNSPTLGQADDKLVELVEPPKLVLGQTGADKLNDAPLVATVIPPVRA
ncbi:hypothetical protein JCM11491_004720 [Sporobolomyces phaffii]